MKMKRNLFTTAAKVGATGGVKTSITTIATLALLSLSVSTGTSYSVSFALNHDEGATPTQEDPYVESKQERFLGNILGSASLKLNSLNAEISGFQEGKGIGIYSDYLAINYLDSTLVEGNVDLSSKFAGNISVRYGDLEQGSAHISASAPIVAENATIYASNERAIVKYRDGYYFLDMDTLGDMVAVITNNFDLGALMNTFSSKEETEDPNKKSTKDTVSDILGEMENAITNAQEKVLDDGYSYTFATTYGDITLYATPELTFKGVEAELSIKVSDEMTLKILLNASGEQDLNNNLVTNTLQDFDASTAANLDGLDPLLITIFDIAKTKKFDGYVNLGIQRGEEEEKNASIRLSADFDDLKNKGDSMVVQAAINENGNDSYVKGNVMATFTGNRTYIDVNGHEKGYLDYTSVSDLMDILGSESGASDAINVAEVAAKFLGDSALSKMLQGDYSVYDQFLKGLETNTDGSHVTLYISNVALGLNKLEEGQEESKEDCIKVELFYSPETPLQFYKAKVSNILFGNNKFSVEIGLQNNDGHSFKEINQDNYSYTYNGALGFIGSLMKIVNEKKFALSYDITIGNNKLAYSHSLDGTIAADLSSIKDISLEENNLPLDAVITAHTKVENVDHYIDARKIDGTTYVAYDDVLKESMKDEELGSIINAVMTGVAQMNDKGAQSDESSESTALNTVLNKISTIFSVSDGLNMENLEKFFSVSPSSDEDTLILKVNTSIIDLGFGTIELALDSSEEKFLSVSITGVEYKDYVFSMNLNYDKTSYHSYYEIPYFGQSKSAEEYKSEFEGTEVTDFHYMASGIFHLITSEKQQYAISLKANMSDALDKSKYGISIDGKAQFDIKNSIYQGKIVADIDENNYDPVIEFAYNDKSVQGEESAPRLYALYTHENSDGTPVNAAVNKIGVALYGSTISSTIDTVTSINETNLLYRLIHSLSNATSSLPLSDMISGDYDYFKILNLDLINKIDITNQSLDIYLNTDALGLTDNGGEVKISVAYGYEVVEEEKKGVIKGLSITGLELLGKEFSLEASLVDYEEEFHGVEYPMNEVGYISMDDLPLFIKLGLNSTDKQTFTMDGHLRVSIPVIDDFYTNIYFGLNVNPGENGEKTTFDVYLRLSDYHQTYSSEFFYDSVDKDFLIVKHDLEKVKTTMKYVTSDELIKHIGYYLLGEGLNFSADIASSKIIPVKTLLVSALDNLDLSALGSTSSEEESEEVKEDKGGILGSAILPENLIHVKESGHTYLDEQQKKGIFSLALDLSSIDVGVKGIHLGNLLKAYVTHDENSLTGFGITGKVVSVASLASISVDIAMEKSEPFALLETKQAYRAYYDSQMENKNYYVIDKVEQLYHQEFMGHGSYYYISVEDNNTLENPSEISIDDVVVPEVNINKEND